MRKDIEEIDFWTSKICDNMRGDIGFEEHYNEIYCKIMHSVFCV